MVQVMDSLLFALLRKCILWFLFCPLVVVSCCLMDTVSNSPSRRYTYGVSIIRFPVNPKTKHAAPAIFLFFLGGPSMDVCSSSNRSACGKAVKKLQHLSQHEGYHQSVAFANTIPPDYSVVFSMLNGAKMQKLHLIWNGTTCLSRVISVSCVKFLANVMTNIANTSLNATYLN